MDIILILFLVVLVALVFFVISIYNRLVQFKVRVTEGASDIDVQLKRRYDLIPNLIETVKGSAKFEQETLQKVIAARQQAISIGSGDITAEKIAAENQLSGALRQLFALSESYPDLKSNQNYLQLQTELANTEDRILASRRFYNSVVSDYNAYQVQFPAVLFRSIAQAKEAPFFELENPTEERKNVAVKF
jgi:LemA protein